MRIQISAFSSHSQKSLPRNALARGYIGISTPVQPHQPSSIQAPRPCDPRPSAPACPETFPNLRHRRRSPPAGPRGTSRDRRPFMLDSHQPWHAHLSASPPRHSTLFCTSPRTDTFPRLFPPPSLCGSHSPVGEPNFTEDGFFGLNPSKKWRDLALFLTPLGLARPPEPPSIANLDPRIPQNIPPRARQALELARNFGVPVKKAARVAPYSPSPHAKAHSADPLSFALASPTESVNAQTPHASAPPIIPSFPPSPNAPRVAQVVSSKNYPQHSRARSESCSSDRYTLNYTPFFAP